jgi:hypothetical protein
MMTSGISLPWQGLQRQAGTVQKSKITAQDEETATNTGEDGKKMAKNGKTRPGAPSKPWRGIE